jgi:hypothetical protein
MAEPPDLGDPSSYLVLADGTPVYASGGEEVGKVEHVLAEPDLDLFDGIVVKDPRVADGHLFVDASQVDECFERGVVLKLDMAAAEDLPAPTANPEEIEIGPDDVVPDNFHDKMRKAWNRISGNY